jgi:MtN3 and saliva related transmembrane protein
MIHAVGWFSSLVLLATVLHQVSRQWRRDTDEGASIWLFSGQFVASLGFTIYSVLLRNWVFTVTNAVLFVVALTGFIVAAAKRRRSRLRQAQKAVVLTARHSAAP